ncbi:hypothetical protein NLG97_g5821 [Lecanicillium saksenae]|uniref:Uncharacterized protein n=1 Tax=Lecanicillium saksenae TaxID=468837 RepID=A0ACC1QTY8_9HYPO|nr:hypothetical protein NLG97_g5821 [Lecanicillium saksenae]
MRASGLIVTALATLSVAQGTTNRAQRGSLPQGGKKLSLRQNSAVCDASSGEVHRAPVRRATTATETAAAPTATTAPTRRPWAAPRASPSAATLASPRAPSAVSTSGATPATGAGKEFVLGFWDAFSGIAVLPYRGTRDEGVKGLGKGIWRGGKGFFCGLGAAIFGLPGYTLKGVERELSKRHLTKLKAEIILIRLRTSLMEFREASPEQREAVIDKWMAKF